MKTVISRISWPVLLTLCLLVTEYGFVIEKPVLFFNVAYLFLALSLFVLERFMPHEAIWNENDGQTFANIAHTLMSKGTVQMLVVFSTLIGLSALATPAAEAGYGFWPRTWPLWIQVIVGVVIAEFGLYWAHRLGHEWLPLWRFHAVHHSVTRLWIINTGRFHIIDSLTSIVFGVSLLLLLGAPMEVLIWLSAVTAFIGLLTHCNVDMCFGVLSWWFNTPELHRWHHSRDILEGNKNYGENLMLWDHVFGTWFNPEKRRPPVNIGINEYMPPSFVQQLILPFQKNFSRKKSRAFQMS